MRFPIERIENAQLRKLLEDVAIAIALTNDPAVLRALGQSLKLLGDQARSAAFSMTKDTW